jgi:CheY-like chemotaxis protein
MVGSPNGRPSPRSYPDLVALRCLIVDDNPGFLQTASALLEQEGVQVVAIASTCEEASQFVADLRPDVTLIDIDLGGESGFDLARRLVDDPHAEPGHLILISAYSEDEFLDMIAASPAIGFVKKPALSAKAIDRLVRAAGTAGPRSGDPDGPSGPNLA